MARNKLTDTQVKNAVGPMKIGDGDGLWLHVSKTGNRSFVFIFIRDGRRREMGLGSYGRGTGQVSLAQARAKADEIRTILGRGGDPFMEMGERKDKVKIATFGEVAEALMKSKESGWKNAKHADQWRMTLRTYCKPLWKLPVATINVDDVMKVIEPMWREKQETASRTRGRIEMVIDYALARELRTAANPARWQGHLQTLLPARQKLARGHHPALPYAEAPAFIIDLRRQEGFSAKALEFLVMTAARTGEVIGAVWDEIDLEAGTWTVPAVRMKAGREHVVALSPAATALLKAMPRLEGNKHLFPGAREGRGLSNMAMLVLLKRMKRDDLTAHGFRSSFSDWARNETGFPRELIEEALAHTLPAVEAAYRRGQAIERRRELMTAWANHLDGKGGKNVISIRQAEKS